jgi:hypothetical protein
MKSAQGVEGVYWVMMQMGGASGVPRPPDFSSPLFFLFLDGSPFSVSVFALTLYGTYRRG